MTLWKRRTRFLLFYLSGALAGESSPAAVDVQAAMPPNK
jgi:hypothetical protein